MPFSLTWQVPYKTKSRKRKKKKKKKEKKKTRYSSVGSSSTIKKLNFSNIEYDIIFLITQISSQQCHVGNSLGTWVHWTQVLFRTRFCGTRVLKKWYITKYFQNNASLSQILPKRGIWLFSPTCCTGNFCIMEPLKGPIKIGYGPKKDKKLLHYINEEKY